MMRCLPLWIAVLAMQTAVAASEHQTARSEGIEGIGEPDRTGILTDRLTAKQARVWKEMERLALETGDDGQPIHPILCELYQWAQHGGQRIYIEMPARLRAASPVAGRFIEDPPTAGGCRVARILLFLETVDRAFTRSFGRSSSGFIPFENLKGHWRYLETLAHELTHFRLTVSDPNYARLMNSRIGAAERLVELHRLRAAGAGDIVELEDARARLDSLTEQIEAPALEVEQAVHRELVAGSRKKVRRSAKR